MKNKMRCLLSVVLPLLASAVAWAQAPAAADAAAKPASLSYFVWTTVFIAVGFSFTTALAALGQGMAVRGGLEGIARQPEASDKIQISMLLGLAFIESLVLFALFIHIILLFANPFIKYLQ